jgi:hypothetical protein
MVMPNPENGELYWTIPSYIHHSFVSLTYHEQQLTDGKVSRPDWVLDPWTTKLPDIYEAVAFHRAWPLDQLDPLSGLDNSNIDMGTPSN